MRVMQIVIIALLTLLPLFNCQTEEIELTGTYGTIKVGDIRNPYGDDIDRTWRITVRPGYRVHVYFTTFDLEDSYEDDIGACAYDYLQVEGHRRLCGNRRQFPQDAPKEREIFQSQGNVMVMRFVSDYSNEDPKPIGFEAHWMEKDIDECFDLRLAVNSGVEDWDQILYCNHFCHNIGGSYYCSCRPGYTLDANEHTCVANCEAEVEAVESGGIVQSPEYPNAYGKLSDCETSLDAGSGKRMDIRFDDVFGIEEHYEEGCVYDYLEITDHRGNTTRYCGNTAPANGSWITLDSNPIKLFFYSDLTLEKSGYAMHYRVYRVQCHEVLLPPANGRIDNRPDKENFEYEDKISFACNTGYRLIGSNITECMADGEWSTPTPTCQIKYCPRPDALLNISRTNPPDFDEEERPFNSSLTIPCINQWYELLSGVAEWFCDADETWQVRSAIIVPNDNNNYPECRPVCGIKNTKPQFDFFDDPVFSQFIFGGRSARYGEWPWIAYIDLQRGGLEAEQHFCGGSLVDEQYVVTAAHCLHGRFGRIPDHILTVYLGVTNRQNQTHAQVFSVINSAQSEAFFRTNGNLFDGDIAVLKLNATAQIGRYVRPICIPRTPLEINLPETDSKRGVVAGWGLTELNRTARIMRLVRVPFVNSSYCLQVYQEQSQRSEFFRAVTITNNQFCAGYLDLARDSCKGDSGGPLMWRNDRRWLLNGIVSFGTHLGECREYVLGVYTKVANFLEFLDNNIILAP